MFTSTNSATTNGRQLVTGLLGQAQNILQATHNEANALELIQQAQAWFERIGVRDFDELSGQEEKEIGELLTKINSVLDAHQRAFSLLGTSTDVLKAISENRRKQTKQKLIEQLMDKAQIFLQEILDAKEQELSQTQSESEEQELSKLISEIKKLLTTHEEAESLFEDIFLTEFDPITDREEDDAKQVLIDVEETETDDDSDKFAAARELLDESIELLADIKTEESTQLIEMLGNIAEKLEELEDACDPDEQLSDGESEENEETTTNNPADPEEPNNAPAKYAPVMPIKKGKYVIAATTLQWTDIRGASGASVRRSANEVAKTYKEMSHGDVEMDVVVNTLRTGMPRSRTNTKVATSRAKKAFDNLPPGRVLFATVTNGGVGRSHAGGNSAALISSLITTFKHEIGHILKGNDENGRPIPNLGHANRWAVVKSGKGRNSKEKLEFQSSRDGTSFMSIYPSGELNGYQTYTQGWFSYCPEMIRMFEIGDPDTVIKLQVFSEKEKTDQGIANGVYVPLSEGKQPLLLSMYLSRPKGKDKKRTSAVSFYTGSKGGSTKFPSFGTEYVSEEGFSVEVLSKNDEFCTVKFKTTPKPGM